MSFPREAVVFTAVIAGLFVVLVLRDGRRHNAMYSFDAVRAKQEIDQSYVLLISNVEDNLSTASKDEKIDSSNEPQQPEQPINEMSTAGSVPSHSGATAMIMPELCWRQAANEVMGNFLRSEKDGFFVECCDFTEETDSRTSFLEKACGWFGLLLVPAREQLKSLARKNRRVLLSPLTLPVDGEQTGVPPIRMSQFIKPPSEAGGLASLGRTSVPLEALLLAVYRRRVSLLALHARGRESDILAAIPFERLDVQAISVPHSANESRIEEFLGGNGYIKVETTPQDLVFLKKES